MFDRYKLLLSILTVVQLAPAMPARGQNSYLQNGTKHPATAHDGKQKSASQDGILLRQYYRVLGATTVSSTKHAIKIYSTGNQIVILSRAPNWDVIEYSMATKKYCQSDLGHAKPFMQKTFALFSGNVLALAPVFPSKSTSVCGISATELRSPKSYYEQQLLRRKQKLCDSASPTTVQLIVTNDVNFNAKAGAVAGRILGLPVPPPGSLGFPLDCIYADMDGSPHRMLNTMAAEKMSFPASTFELPAGYTKVNDTPELLADPARDQDLTDFLQEPKHH